MTAQNLELSADDVINLARGGQMTIRTNGVTAHLYPGDANPMPDVDADAVLIPLTASMLHQLHTTRTASWFPTFTETKYELRVTAWA